jgi:hypothetical protein
LLGTAVVAQTWSVLEIQRIGEYIAKVKVRKLAISRYVADQHGAHQSAGWYNKQLLTVPTISMNDDRQFLVFKLDEKNASGLPADKRS